MKQLHRTDSGSHIIEETSTELLGILQDRDILDQVCSALDISIPAAAILAPVHIVPHPAAGVIARAMRAPHGQTRGKRLAAGGTVRVCLKCGKSYKPVRKDQKFCGKACGKGYSNTHRTPKPVKPTAAPDTGRLCAGPCGKTFMSKRVDQKLCADCSKKFAGSLDRASKAAKTSSPATATPPPLLPLATNHPPATVDRLAAIREADRRARMKRGGVIVPPSTFGSADSMNGAPTEDDIAKIRAGRED